MIMHLGRVNIRYSKRWSERRLGMGISEEKSGRGV